MGIDQAFRTAAGLGIDGRIDVGFAFGFRMAVAKADIAGAGKFAVAMARGVHAFILAGGTGDVHAGFAPPEAGAGGEVGGLGLLVAEDETLGWAADGSALEGGRAGKSDRADGDGFDRIGQATEEEGIVAVADEVKVEVPIPDLAAGQGDGFFDGGIVEGFVVIGGAAANGGAPPIGQFIVGAAAEEGDGEGVSIIVGVNLGEENDLAQIVQAGNFGGFAFGVGQGRQQHGGENGDDGNHHEQLNQRKSDETSRLRAGAIYRVHKATVAQGGARRIRRRGPPDKFLHCQVVKLT